MFLFRIALQSMLISNSESLTTPYHIVRWELKIATAIDAVVTDDEDPIELDPEDEQDPLELRRTPKFGQLAAVGNCLQLYLYCTYQLGRHWLHFKREAAKNNYQHLTEGWDVLSRVNFAHVSVHPATSTTR